MSPRFVNGKENAIGLANRQYANCSTEFSILISLPKEDLVELVLNTRKQLKHYIRMLEEKDNKLNVFKKECKNLSE